MDDFRGRVRVAPTVFCQFHQHVSSPCAKLIFSQGLIAHLGGEKPLGGTNEIVLSRNEVGCQRSKVMHDLMHAEQEFEDQCDQPEPVRVSMMLMAHSRCVSGPI